MSSSTILSGTIKSWWKIGLCSLALLPVPAVMFPGEGSASPILTCTNNPAQDTPALQSAITAAAKVNGTVTVAAGICALNNHLAVHGAATITGAGQSSTFIVQHARVNIFDITGQGVTVENVNLDTATYNATYPPILKNPDPGFLFSNADNTTVKHVTGEAGSGFGMRITGPTPCSSFPNYGATVSDVKATTTGTGGFAAVDIDCQHQAALSSITIHGGILALYNDTHVTLTGENFTPGPYAITCARPWEVTGPSDTIGIDQVLSAGGAGRVNNTLNGIVTNLLVTNQTIASGC